MVQSFAFYVSWFLFFGIPLVFLGVGFILFLVRSRIRKTIGGVLVVLGSLELSLWFILTRITIVSEIMVYIATIILGLFSLYYASRNSKH